MSQVIHTSAQTFELDVLHSSVPVLIDFYADWCGPCQRLAPTLDRIAGEFADKVRIVKVNVDDEPGLANQFRVESIPTLVFVVDGQIAGRTAGLMSEPALRQALNRLIQNSNIA